MGLSADEVKEGRKKLGISQVALAWLVGVSTMAVYRWEAGDFSPNLERTAKLCKVFKQGVPKGLDAQTVIEAELRSIKMSLSKIILAFRELKKEV